MWFVNRPVTTFAVRGPLLLEKLDTLTIVSMQLGDEWFHLGFHHPLAKTGIRKQLWFAAIQLTFPTAVASDMASAPASDRIGEDGSVTARQTACATSLAYVTSDDCRCAPASTCLAQSAYAAGIPFCERARALALKAVSGATRNYQAHPHAERVHFRRQAFSERLHGSCP
jgi:hypothetical protein